MKMPNYKTLSVVSLKDVKISLINFLDSNDYGVLSEYDWGCQLAVRVQYKAAESLYNKLVKEA
jgi:hypothetical protein